jgi:hypothetical protein
MNRKEVISADLLKTETYLLWSYMVEDVSASVGRQLFNSLRLWLPESAEKSIVVTGLYHFVQVALYQCFH